MSPVRPDEPPTPIPGPWDDEPGDDGVRDCEECGSAGSLRGDFPEWHEELRRVLHPACVGAFIGNHTPDEA